MLSLLLTTAALALPVHRPSVDPDGVEVPPLHAERIALARHEVGSVALSPSGELLALGEPRGRIRLLSTSDWAQVGLLEGGHARLVTELRWSQDGHTLVSRDRRTVCAWDPEQLDPLWIQEVDATVPPQGLDLVQDPTPWEPSPWFPAAVRWGQASPDPLPQALPRLSWKTLEVQGSWLEGTTREGPRVRRSLEDGGNPEIVGPAAPVWGTEGEAEGKRISARATHGEAEAVGLLSGRILLRAGGDEQKLVRHREEVTTLSYSPDGTRLASGAEGGSTILWDLQTDPPRPLARTGLGSPVTALALSEDLWVAGTRDGDLHILDLEGHELHELEGHAGAVTDILFAAEGGVVITASRDERVRLWDPWQGRLLQVFEGHEAPVRDLALHPSGAAVYSADKAGAILRWELALDGKPQRLEADLALPLRAVAWAPDGSVVYVGSEDGSVRAFDPDTGEQRDILGTHARAVLSLAVSPDGSLVASGSDDHTTRLWRSQGGLDQALRGARTPVLALAFSPDGGRLATTATDGSVRVWRLEDGEAQQVLSGFEQSISALDWSGDGRHLLAGSRDKTARVFDLVRGGSTLLVGPWGSLRDADLAPDDRTVAVASMDGSVRIWLPDGRTLTHAAHGRMVNAVAFSPDGRWLTSAGADGAVRLVDAHTGAPGSVLTAHLAGVWDVAWSPHGDRLASVGEDGRLVIWSVPEGLPVVRTLALTDGSWASHTAGGRLYGSASVLEAPAASSLEVASARLVIAPVDGVAPGRLEVSVRSSGQAPAWDVRLASTWTQGALLTSDQVIPRLEPGREAVLVASVVSVGGAEGAPLEVRVESAGAPPVKQTIELDPSRPHLALDRALRPHGDEPGLLFLRGDTSSLHLEVDLLDRGGEVLATLPVDVDTPSARDGVPLPSHREVRHAARVRVRARSTAWPGHAWTLEAPLRAPVPWWLLGGGLFASLLLLTSWWLPTRLKTP